MMPQHLQPRLLLIAAGLVAILLLGAGAIYALLTLEGKPVPPAIPLVLGAAFSQIQSLLTSAKNYQLQNGIKTQLDNTVQQVAQTNATLDTNTAHVLVGQDEAAGSVEAIRNRQQEILDKIAELKGEKKP